METEKILFFEDVLGDLINSPSISVAVEGIEKVAETLKNNGLDLASETLKKSADRLIKALLYQQGINSKVLQFFYNHEQPQRKIKAECEECDSEYNLDDLEEDKHGDFSCPKCESSWYFGLRVAD